MSSPLAIAAITATLKDLLNDGLLNHDLSSVGSFSVTATPPDRVTTGTNEPNQLNLFLYRVTGNPGWRNVGLPSQDGAGTRLSNAPLALDLHYMLTAYGSQDLNAEILLGYAMHLLHETPVLTRAKLRTVLAATSPVDGSILPSPFGTLGAIDLADQVELVKITPNYLSTEELSKLWTAMQARYRPTMAYTVTVVLIEGSAATRQAPPVLKRGAGDRGPTAFGGRAPALLAAHPAASNLLPAARLGDDVTIHGERIEGGGFTVRFENGASGVIRELASSATGGGQLTVHLPAVSDDAQAMADWATGLYQVSLVVTPPGAPSWTTNAVPLALAPLMSVSPVNAAPGTVNLQVTCTPRLRGEQAERVQLVFGTRTVSPASVSTPGDPTQPTTLQFTIPNVVAGEYLVRLRVDGIDSLPVTVSGPPVKLDFDPQQKVTVA